MYIWHASTAGSSCANCAQQQQQQSHQRRQQPYGRAQRTPRTAPPPQKNSQDHSCADTRIPAPNGVLGTEKAIRQASERLFARRQAAASRDLHRRPGGRPDQPSPASRLACSPSRCSYQPNEQASLLAEPALVPAQRAGSYQPSKRVSLLNGLVQVPDRRSGQPARQAGTCTSPAIRSTCSPSRCSCQPNEQASLLAEPVLVPAQQQAGQPARWAGAGTSPAIRSTYSPSCNLHQPGEQADPLAGLVQVPAWQAALLARRSGAGNSLACSPDWCLYQPSVYLLAKSPWQAVVYPLAGIPWRGGVYRTGSQGLSASALTRLPGAMASRCTDLLTKNPWQACLYTTACQEPLASMLCLPTKSLGKQLCTLLTESSWPAGW
ncbi:hypothetical protein PCASD_18017 [Puccinia coronata f. sp. avenae]|uniref:Uncharacterized protein n=1 Tax=Puccinia coronata f. sp. avenae TaxID=200324 RepID=A0A2N5UC74_9BASI|nr:hypothetical protein PCASD_18017 [Puccinia coronata f. sp. avenae]